tara:strand:+ start:225 stop:470 length:246 start_codon:yes stop_codon:yes gene_type:complete
MAKKLFKKRLNKVRVGDLVKYIPSPSATFKWEKYTDAFKAVPGVILREVEARGVATRRFEIRWHDGQISEEWISYLEPYEV